MIVNSITDKLSQLGLAYGRHVAGTVISKYLVEATAPAQATLQQPLGAASWWDAANSKWMGGGWEACENLYYNGFEIEAANYNFHSGGGADAADAFFPDDITHPKASYISGRLPQGQADQLSQNGGTPDPMIGIYKCLKVANYNADGLQIDDVGALLPGGANPETYLYYSPSPMRAIADMFRRARRPIGNINWPAWVARRDYDATLINWDDGALTPHQIFIAAAAGGTLAPATYWVRVATLKGADISSASKDRATDGIATASVVCSGGNLKFNVEWASQLERGATGYRVYIGTAEGAEDRYFTVGSGATNTLEVSTLTGATMGAPPAIATGVLLRQIPRFESNVFFVPPFTLATAIDRIAQICCMDFHYANGKLVFLTPEMRDPVFTLNLAEIGDGSFKTYRTDRRQKPNQIVVSYRDLDDQFLSPADPPVIINRSALQLKEGVRPFLIDMGCAYRSQAERTGNYWARRLIDSDQMLEVIGSPRTYFVLPGDPVLVTHDVPDWEDVSFYIESKEEGEDTKAGYPMTARLYGEWYSDTSHEPLPRPLPSANPSPFIAPPVVVSVVLTEDVVELTNGAPFTVIRGGVEFAPFIGHQRGRVWWKKPGGAYEATDITLVPDSTTLESAFELTGVAIGVHAIKVVTESEMGVSLAFGDHVEYTINVTGDLVRAAVVTDVVVMQDGYGDKMIQFIMHPKASEKPANGVVEVWFDADRDDPVNDLKGTLPVTTGTAHACLLNATGFEVGGIGNPPDEEVGGGGTTVTSEHSDRNNLVTSAGTEVLVAEKCEGVTLEQLDDMFLNFQQFDFTIQWLGADGEFGVPYPGTGALHEAVVGLQTRANADPVANGFAPNLALCPLSVEWEPGTLAGTIKEIYKSFGVEIASRDNVDPGFGNWGALITRSGPRYTFLLAGTEYRAIVDYPRNRKPQAIVATPPEGFAFPLRLAGKVTPPPDFDEQRRIGITNITAGGNLKSTTIFSKRDQIEKLGATRAREYLRIYQKSNYDQIPDGIPVDVVAPPL